MYVVVTILILIDGFLQYSIVVYDTDALGVTILILIDGFLQCGLLVHYQVKANQSQSLF